MDEEQTAALHTQKRRLESERFALEGDLKRATLKRQQIIDEIGRLKKMMSRFEADIQTQEQTLIRVERDMTTLKSELDQLKKKANTL